MAKGRSKSKHMIITLEAEGGKIVSVVDENGRKATKLSSKELDRIHKSRRGLRHVGTILHSHSSPDCLYFIIGGWAVRICF